MRSRSLAILVAVGCSSPQSKPPPATPAEPVSTVVPPAPRTPPKPPVLRLGDRVKPTRYALDLTIVPTEETFRGKVTIALTLAEPTTVIWLHADELSVRTATIRANGAEQPARPIAPTPLTDETKELLAFELDRPIGPGTAELAIAYEAKLSAKEVDGLYREQDRGEWYAFTQFESTSARRAFPCFDEPLFKVPFQITLHVKSDHVAVSNAPATGETTEPNGMKTVRFAETKPLPTYLIAFGVGPFEIVDGGKGGKAGIPLRIIVPKGRAAEAAYATKATPELLALIEDYFGVPYPYEKLDQIAVPRKGGAMENAGLITYGMPLIAIPRDEETIARKRRFARVAVHEIGHHWFGDLVTLAYWDDIWLNESFASWIEDKILERWQPTWGTEAGLVVQRADAMGSDKLATARKIRQPITSRHDISAAFDGITYGKGGAILTMFERWIGPDKFQRGLKRYFEKHAHGTATTADFMAAISTEAGLDVAPAFSTFLDQVGTPLVGVELVCAPNAAPKLALTQSRYVPIGSKAPAEQLWKIPLCAKFGDGAKTAGRACTLLAEQRGELQLPTKTCPTWVLANDGEIGYYRVEYAGDLLERVLDSKAITVAERVGLVGDLEALVLAGRAPIGKALARLPALARDADRHVTDATIDLALWLADGKHLVPPELRPNRDRFVRKLFADRARSLGWASPKGEDDNRRLTRPMLLALAANLGEDPVLIKQAKQLADRWLSDRKAIDPDLVSFVLGAAARHGDRALFDRMLAAAKAEKEIKDRQALLRAMGSFRDPEVAKAALALTLTDEFEGRETIGLVYGALEHGATRELAYQFVKQHLDALRAKLQRDSGARFVGIGAAFCDEAHRDDAAAFFKDRAPTYLNGPRALARMIEAADLCMATKAALQPGVVEFLKKQ